MRFTAIAAFVLSTSAFACPNLAGKYTSCRSNTGAAGGSTDMVVTQSIVNKATVYNLQYTNENGERETESYKADGKVVKETYTDADSGISMTTQTTASCANDALNIKMDVYFMGQKAGWSEMKVRKNGKQMIVDSKGNDGEEDYKDTLICE